MVIETNAGTANMNRHHPAHRQSGAVAIMTALSLFLLIAMIGLVVDLGYLYTRKTELQNAADAAALAGARELNGSAAGVTAAAAQAIALANANSSDLDATPVVITNANIQFGPSPDGPWLDVAASSLSDTAAADKYFIKVDTSGIAQGTRPTWFMGVVSSALANTDTFGMAVAGHYIVDVAPMAACALDGSTTKPCLTANCGYQAGKGYDLSEINPVGPGTIYWIDPVATAPGECSGDVPSTLPFVCQGKVAAAVASAATVYTNTGLSNPQLEALDSRFGSYGPDAKCDPATAPPDLNIKQYNFEKIGSLDANPAVSEWVTSAPTQQASKVTSPKGSPVITTDNDGVVWSYVRPADGPLAGRSPTGKSYPATGTPYTQTSGDDFYEPPPSGLTGAANRRVLNILIVACPTAGGICQPAPVLGIGQFLLQRKTNLPSDKEIYVEFGRMIPVNPAHEIRLYR